MEELEKEVEKQVTKAVTSWVTIFVEAVVTFVVMVVVLKFVWAWVVSDLFPGAVTQGLINAELTWLATVKLAVLAAVLSGGYHTLMEVFTGKK